MPRQYQEQVGEFTVRRVGSRNARIIGPGDSTAITLAKYGSEAIYKIVCVAGKGAVFGLRLMWYGGAWVIERVSSPSAETIYGDDKDRKHVLD